MPSLSETLALAIQHHQAGRFPAAEQLYRQILQADPQQADAWHFLGVLASQVGQTQAAIDYIRRAITLNPAESAYYGNLGVVFQETNNLDQASACFRRALQLAPDYAEAHYNLGVVLQRQAKSAEAIAYYRKALELKPDYPLACNNLGNALREQGRLDEAVNVYQRALALQPDYAEAHNNLGNAFKDQRKLEEAVACFRRALEIKPDLAEAYNNQGDVLRLLGRPQEAAACYQKAVERQPDFVEAYNNLGIALQDLGQLNEAVVCYQRALKLRPDFAEVYNNLGAALQNLGQLDEALKCYRQAVQLKPAVAETHTNLGNALREQGRLDEAVASYQRAVEIDPDSIAALCQLVHQKKQLCLWQDLNQLSQRVIAAVDQGAGGVPPFLFINLATSAEQQLRCARQRIEQELKWTTQYRERLGFTFARPEKAKIRLGYVTAHVREHSMASQIAELFERHDRQHFEVYAYHYGPDDGSAMRKRMLAAFDQSRDIQNDSSVAAARRIHQDEVDILIDLVGHMHGARSEIFAMRPAPLQVMFMGYPGTTGADFMDYVIVDDFLAPPDQQPFYSEQLVQLPDCFQANDRQRRISSRTPSREECGLPPRGFVFCCFNQTHKITPEMFDVWMRLLCATEGSVLWLWESNRWAAPHLRGEAEARGVDSDRLIFAPRRPMAEHLARYRVADLALDTLPYNGHTITSESLWAGCPVLTLAGATFASRVAGSLLNADGLPELISYSFEQYERLGLELASDARRLGDLRRRVAENRETMALFDSIRFTGNLERAYQQMWEIYRAAEPPRAFRVR